jgi:CRISPR-associated protein Cas5d
MHDGVICFNQPEECPVKKVVRAMSYKKFCLNDTVRAADEEWAELEVQA